MSDKPFIAICECNADHMQVHLQVDREGYETFGGFLTFSSWWQQQHPWAERVKLAWLALRGKEHYFAEVILDREDSERLFWYLGGQLQLNVTQFTFTNTNTSNVS